MNRATLFGRFIREKRSEQGLSLNDVAEKIGVSVAYVSDVERGQRAPFDPIRFEGLSEILGVSVVVLEEKALLTRGVLLHVGERLEEQEAALALARNWGGLSSEILLQISRLLRFSSG